MLSDFCRSLNYYVDTSTEEIIELGTKEFPFRTLGPVFLEILKQHSHTEREVNIYIKEGTNVFLEDSTAYLINVTKVMVTSYHENGVSEGMAVITTTDEAVEKVSKKAAFHIMKDFTADKATVIGNGNFSDEELISIGRTGDAFHCVRGSLEISKISAHRVSSSTTSGVLIYLLYLQNRDLRLTDMEFHVTGQILYTKDPVNVYFENLYVDTYQVAAGFMFWPGCNYPEAYLTPTFYVNNFTAYVSGTEAESFRPNVLYYSGPGNVTANNINITNNYGLSANSLATILFTLEGL